MKIWIDLANAPHVPFFVPIIRELERRGHYVILTMRDFNQTAEISQKNGLRGTIIGKHGGKSSVGKLLNLFSRAAKLACFCIKSGGVDIAVSHNSYTQSIAARLIGVRVVTIMDYEGQPANHIAFRFAHRVIVPMAFPEKALRRFGCPARKVIRYDGFKEQVYVSDFRPNEAFGTEIARICGQKKILDEARTLVVTVRTPASMAAYHKFTNHLFERLLEKLRANPKLTVVLLARSADQREYYREKFPQFHIPAEPISGMDLVYFSDLVVSAGGTMNREAAVLGTPAFTIFAGKLPAVDKELIKMGRLVAIESEGDLNRMRFEKRKMRASLKNPRLVQDMVTWITSW